MTAFAADSRPEANARALLTELYTVATAALAIGMPIKWVDNVLSHNKLIGIRQDRQGVARRLSIEGLLVLALTALLIEELGLSTAKAIVAAEGMVTLLL